MPKSTLSGKLLFTISPILACALTGASITSHAATVVVTVTGTAEGGDQYDIFHVGGRFRDQSFTLIFTFDDSVNTEKSQNGFCPGLHIRNSGSSSSAPVTAVLSIGDGSFTFGEDPTGNWSIVRCADGEIFLTMNEGIEPHIEGFDLRLRPEGKSAVAQSLDWKTPLAKIDFAPAAHRVLINHANDFEHISEAFLRVENVDFKMPLCGDPSLPFTYKKDDTYHKYQDATEICSINQSAKCTVDTVFDVMLRTPASIAPVVPAVRSGEIHSCSVLQLVSCPGHDNKIRLVIDESQHSITNYTQPEHIFFPGQVTRKVVNRNGLVIVETIGEGNGSYPTMNAETGTCKIWPDADQALRVAVWERLKLGLPPRLAVDEVGCTTATSIMTVSCNVIEHQ